MKLTALLFPRLFFSDRSLQLAPVMVQGCQAPGREEVTNQLAMLRKTRSYCREVAIRNFFC